MIYGLFIYTVIAISHSGTVYKDWRLLSEFRSENNAESLNLCKEAAQSSQMKIAEGDYRCIKMGILEQQKDRVH
jgi:hypothetical protein